MKRLILIICILAALSLEAITLPECLQRAEENFSNARNIDIVQEMRDLNYSALNSQYLPQLKAIALYNYQSEGTDIEGNGFPVEIKFPRQSQTAYSGGLQLQQLIFDGGRIKESKYYS